MNKYFWILFFFLNCFVINAQQWTIDDLDIEWLEEGIEKVETIGWEHIFRIYKNGKYGAVDTLGREVIPVEYDELYLYKNGITACRKGELWGLYNFKKRKEIIAPKYQKIIRFDTSTAIVKANYRLGVIDMTGKEILPVKYDEVRKYKGNFLVNEYSLWSLITPDGKVLTQDQYPEIEAKSNFIKVRNGGKWGVIDRIGKIIIPVEYEEIKFDHTEIIKASKLGEVDLFYKKHKINYKPYEFKYIINSRYVLVRDAQNKFGLLSFEGEVIVPLEYDELFKGTENVLLVKKGKKYGLLYLNKDYSTELLYDNRAEFNEYGKALVKKAGNWHLLDTTGQIIKKLDLDIDRVSEYKNGFWTIKKKYKSGFVNRNGKLVVPPIYDKVKPFFNGVARVIVGYKRGVVDTLGNVVIPPKYSRINKANDKGIMAVYYDKKIGFANRYGQEILKPALFKRINLVSEKLALIFENRNIGFINLTTGQTIAPKYRMGINFFKGYSAAGIDRKWCLVNEEGKEVTPFLFESKRILVLQDYTMIKHKGRFGILKHPAK